jgi:hypothetical protein
MKKETSENPQAQTATTAATTAATETQSIVISTINTPPLSPEAKNAAEEFLKIKKALTGETPEKVWCYPPQETCKREVPPIVS